MLEFKTMKETSSLVSIKEAQEILGIKNTKFYKLMKLPNFPKPKCRDGKKHLYCRSDFEPWVYSTYSIY